MNREVWVIEHRHEGEDWGVTASACTRKAAEGKLDDISTVDEVVPERPGYTERRIVRYIPEPEV